MRLVLAPQFASEHRDANGLLNVSLEVAYFDDGTGRRELSYPAAGGKRGVAMTVARADSGRWKVARADGVMMAPTDGEGAEAGGQGGFDFELRSLDEKDEVFSLMEVLVNTADHGAAAE